MDIEMSESSTRAVSDRRSVEQLIADGSPAPDTCYEDKPATFQHSMDGIPATTSTIIVGTEDHKSSTTFSIRGKISYHEVHPDYSEHVPEQPSTGEHWQVVVFCRPALPNLMVPFRNGLQKELIDHYGNVVPGFEWQLTPNCTGSSWYGWVPLEELPVSFWERENGTGMIDDHFLKKSDDFEVYKAVKSRERADSAIGMNREAQSEATMNIGQSDQGSTSSLAANENTIRVDEDPMDALMGSFHGMGL